MIHQNIPFTIPRDKVLLRLHYNLEKSEMTEKIDDLINQMMDEECIIAHARAVTDYFFIDEKRPSEVRLQGTEFVLKGKAISAHLRECYKVTFLVCTIGDGLTKTVQAFVEKNELTKATILDAVGSEAVEAVADSLTHIVAQNAGEEGAIITSRFSPGYGDWPVTEQRKLVELLHADAIGVRVTPKSIMLPEKTISACIGWIKRR